MRSLLLIRVSSLGIACLRGLLSRSSFQFDDSGAAFCRRCGNRGRALAENRAISTASSHARRRFDTHDGWSKHGSVVRTNGAFRRRDPATLATASIALTAVPRCSTPIRNLRLFSMSCAVIALSCGVPRTMSVVKFPMPFCAFPTKILARHRPLRRGLRCIVPAARAAGSFSHQPRDRACAPAGDPFDWAFLSNAARARTIAVEARCG